MEGSGPAAPGSGPPRSLDPRRAVPAREAVVSRQRRQVRGADHGAHAQLQGSHEAELDELAQEVNGFDLTTKQRLDSFAKLKDDGTTTAGDWIYTGSYPESGNLMKRRAGTQDVQKNDPTGMGFFPGWAWSWPLNRRVMYNRASADVK